MLRIPKDKYHAFNDKFPWRGSMTQFFYQCLDEFLEHSKDVPTPAELTSISVHKVASRDY